MLRIFISGSSTGLGLMAGQLLADQGHQVVLHARSEARALEARQALPKAAGVVIGDLQTIAAARDVAAQVNALGRFDAVIHNAAVGYQEPKRVVTADKLPQLFAVNTLSAYILTALIERPQRLVYLSSGLHRQASAEVDDILWEKRRWNGTAAYCESKLHDAMLAFAIARRWQVPANAVEPGWVATRMGGAGATDDLDQGHRTQAWLAADPSAAEISGEYYYHMKRKPVSPLARDIKLQDRLIEICAGISGVPLPD